MVASMPFQPAAPLQRKLNLDIFLLIVFKIPLWLQIYGYRFMVGFKTVILIWEVSIPCHAMCADLCLDGLETLWHGRTWEYL